MTEEEKRLLFIDLSARLPYGVMVFGMFHYDICIADYICEPLNAKMLDINEWDKPRSSYDHHWYSDIKPYLRPFSSMTDEEKSRMYSFMEKDASGFPSDSINKNKINEYMSWVLSHHFDINHLIEKGLAIEMTTHFNA